MNEDWRWSSVVLDGNKCDQSGIVTETVVRVICDVCFRGQEQAENDVNRSSLGTVGCSCLAFHWQVMTCACHSGHSTKEPSEMYPSTCTASRRSNRTLSRTSGGSKLLRTPESESALYSEYSTVQLYLCSEHSKVVQEYCTGVLGSTLYADDITLDDTL